MYHQPLDKKELINRIALYIAMTLSVGVIVTLIVFFILGYRIDTNKGVIEQYSMLQFGSTPSGATITIDGKLQTFQTPSKITVPAGKHNIDITKANYETWSKTIDTKSGQIDWLNYALLVPKSLVPESVLSLDNVYKSLSSTDEKKIIVSEKAETPIFNLVDISSNVVQNSKITIPSSIYTSGALSGVVHKFELSKWDDGGRYVLVRHTYNDKFEWIVVDTQDVNLSKNITKIVNFSIAGIDFSGTSGNSFFILVGEDIRKADLSSGTISRPLVSGVSSFSIYGSNIISYIGNDSSKSQVVAGVYRDGDDNSFVIKTISEANIASVSYSISKYFGQYYFAVSNENVVEIYGGSFPVANSDIANLKLISTFSTSSQIKSLNFSLSGRHLVAQTESNVFSYDLEYQTSAKVEIKGSASNVPIKWLNDSYLWSDRDGNLTIFEFDGLNEHIINSVSVGQAVTLTANGRYLYSVNKVGQVYQLQRVRMILP